MKLDIIFRSCSSVTAVHGNGRPFGADKEEVILRCLHALAATTTAALSAGALASARLVVLDDHSTARCLERMQRILTSCAFPTELHSLAARGNGPSIAACLTWARSHASELFYLVEDDYLHSGTAITEMVEAYGRATGLARDRDPVIFPCDYPDRYQSPYPSFVFLSSHRYWRTVRHTTGTFMTSHRNLERYWDKYIAFAGYGIDPQVHEDNTINLIYREVPCLSPMPTLAEHLHAGMDSPYSQRQAWWSQSEIPAELE
jgi:hypothetical protein